MSSIRLTKAIVSVLSLLGILLILHRGYDGIHAGFYLIAAALWITWALVLYFLVWPTNDGRSARHLVRSFTYQVDLAQQMRGNDPKSVDERVLQAFEKLHAEADTLLRKRLIHLAQLKREVQSAHTPRPAPANSGGRWRPPKLRDLGYVLAVADKYVQGSPVLALYKFSGEERMRGGQVADMYTILKEGNLPGFTGTFAAKTHSPVFNDLTAQDTVEMSDDELDQTARAQAAQTNASADSDHNVAYILSLIGPVRTLDSAVFTANLRELCALTADPMHVNALSAESVRSWQRSLMTERIGYLESSLPLARRALRQEPQLLVAALADVYRNAGEDATALASSLSAVADVLAPVSTHSRPDIAQWLTTLAQLVQEMMVIPETQRFENPGVAYVDARGAESSASLLKRTAELVRLSLEGNVERVFKVYMFTQLSAEEFQTRLRGFRDLHAGEEDQAVIRTLLQAVHDENLLLQSIDVLRPIIARELPRPAGHQFDNEVFLTVNPAGIDVNGASEQAHFVLWTLAGRPLYAQVGQIQPLIALAQRIRGYGGTSPAA